MRTSFASLVIGIALAASGAAQSVDYTKTEHTFKVVPNQTYLKAGSTESNLDLYVRRTSTAPEPTLIWIHGGGWNGGAKENDIFAFQSYLAMGLNVVSVEYRFAGVALAP